MHENLLRIKAVNECLASLGQDYVFVGGATVSLYASHASSGNQVRPTDDVDVVVELATYSGYSALDERLREIGFQNDITSGIICRYRIQGIIVDVMPINADVIGFTNKWYAEGFKSAINYRLDDASGIRIFTLPYFVATKWEAFKVRGARDYRTSKDFEDLVYVFENAEDFLSEMQSAPTHLRAYFRDEFKALINTDDFEEGLYAHLSGGYGGIDANYIKAMLEEAFGF